MAEQGSNSFILIAALMTMLPGAYFTWLFLKGLILSLRRSKDNEL